MSFPIWNCNSDIIGTQEPTSLQTSPSTPRALRTNLFSCQQLRARVRVGEGRHSGCTSGPREAQGWQRCHLTASEGQREVTQMKNPTNPKEKKTQGAKPAAKPTQTPKTGPTTPHKPGMRGPSAPETPKR